MDINKFFYLLTVAAVVFIFYKKDITVVEPLKEEKPLVVFENSVAYELSTGHMEYIIKSKKAMSFKNHDQLHDALILARTDKENLKNIDTLSAKTMVKYENDLYLDKNVKYESYDGLRFDTEHLHYNTKNKIAKTEVDFKAIRENDVITGNFLRYDSLSKKITSGNTSFKIQIKD